ncbi:hypothetical protein B0J13DRAFT_618460 [Dactylonectria estremocensis]|uniref:GET complex subunit GET2 n=1 Tax=Dactylonectria estremocensis TaxID=1079267 RepID=A0A9P9F713_9HYPO|nr:hypothetical protein B0J13DRAFT_618460 [Dactylonectria estremocensis]
MTETALSTEEAASQRASEQARLRKERREAKIKAGGSARLSKITGASGGVPRESEPAPELSTATESPASTPAPKPAVAVTSAAAHADPDEVDISDHFYETKKLAARGAGGPALSEDDLRQMMLGFERANTPGQPSPGVGTPTPGNLDEDPMMKMMSQLMSGAGLPQGEGSPFAGMPGMPGAGANPFQPQPAPSSTAVNIWRLLHALVALGLGLYIVLLTPFSGTKIERERASLPIMTLEDPFTTPADAVDVASELEQRKRLFFWTFATAETLLLTTRFFLDKRGPQPTGVVGTALGFVPQPWKGYIEIAMRYAGIFTTVRGDMLACIFVLGACSWYRG